MHPLTSQTYKPDIRRQDEPRINAEANSPGSSGFHVTSPQASLILATVAVLALRTPSKLCMLASF